MSLTQIGSAARTDLRRHPLLLGLTRCESKDLSRHNLPSNLHFTFISLTMNSILSFLLGSGPVDQAQEWAEIDAATRASTKSAYVSAGINLMVSAFGSTENPTSSGLDATTTANTMAAWVKTYTLDGIDVDYEDMTAMNKADGAAEVLFLYPT